MENDHLPRLERDHFVPLLAGLISVMSPLFIAITSYFVVLKLTQNGVVAMKRLVIITVGKTHSGKTTFANALEKQLNNSFVMDQDNHAEFINTYYKNLQPDKGPNTLKHSLSKLIVDYAKVHTDFHFIICNSNLNRKGRLYLLEELFNTSEFVRILVHFDINYDVLKERVSKSQRTTNIFRGAYTNFEEVLVRQQEESLKEDVVDPIEGEADHLFVVKDNEEVDAVIRSIVGMAERKNKVI